MPRIAPLARLLRAPLAPAPTTTPITLLPALRSLRVSVPTPIASSSRSPLSSLCRSTSTLGLTPTPRPTLSVLSSLSISAQRTPGQIRTLAYGAMYQPSQRKRKRKHGFLSRARGGRLGQKTLARRAARGRRFLSH